MPRISGKRSYSKEGTLYDPAAAAVLEAYLWAERWDEARRILQTNKDVLLSESVIGSLRRRIAYLRSQPEEFKSPIDWLVARLQVLDDARLQGIDAAWEQLEGRKHAIVAEKEAKNRENQSKAQAMAADEYLQQSGFTIEAWDADKISETPVAKETLTFSDRKKKRAAQIMVLMLVDTPQAVRHVLDSLSDDLRGDGLIAQLRADIERLRKYGEEQLSEEWSQYLLLLEDAKKFGIPKAWDIHKDRLTFSYARSVTALALEDLLKASVPGGVQALLEGEAAPVFLSQTALDLLRQGSDWYRRNDNEQLTASVEKYLHLIEEARTKGIRTAMDIFRSPDSGVNILGLLDESDIPPELSSPKKAGTLDRAIRRTDRVRYPRFWGFLHNERGESYAHGGTVRDQEQALADFNTALEVFTRDNWPLNWAIAHMNRGEVYAFRYSGNSTENQELAMADYSAALEVFIPELFPKTWSVIHRNIGDIYVERHQGNRAENIELALLEYNAALKFFLSPLLAWEWAQTRMVRGIAYRHRIRGDKAENQEQALADYDAALTVFTRENYPFDWSQTLHNRANIYLDRIRGSRAENMERAIDDLSRALEVRTYESAPFYWAESRSQRGYAYSMRIFGDRIQNQENALGDLNAALKVRTRESMPVYWAQSCLVRGIIYAKRLTGNRMENLQLALADLNAALEVFRPETMPRAYCECVFWRARILERLGKWQEAHRAYVAIREVMQLLTDIAHGDAEHIEILGEFEKADPFLSDVRVLLSCQPPEIDSALCTLEEGRARSLRVALDLDAINPSSMNDPEARDRAKAFINARRNWQKSQRLMASSPYRYTLDKRRQIQDEAYLEMVQALESIRKHDDPDFLSPTPTPQSIARAIHKSDQAIVYVATDDEGGLALVVTRDAAGLTQRNYIPLPQLRDKAISDLLLTEASHTLQTAQGKMTDKVPTGGLALGQMAAAFKILRAWGANVREAEAALPKGSGFQQTAHMLLDAWSKSQARLVDQPFTRLTRKERQNLATTFESSLLNLELRRSLLQIGKIGFSEVAHTLTKLGIHSVTLIPYGRLSLFPLPAVIIQQPDGSTVHLSDLFDVTLAPSARVAEIAQHRAARLDREARPLLLTAGNPQPHLVGAADLPSAEAEASALQRIAEKLGYSASTICHLRPEEITKARVAHLLEQAWFAHLAVHGRYEIKDPRHSRLVLAGDESLPVAERCLFLGEALDGRVNLKGLRLLVLSACETAVIDVLQVPNEVLGIASGFLQAGAAGVLASLWAVDDDATYLLISQFARLYLDQQRQLTPARALAEAQRWLREEATNRVLATYDPVSPNSRRESRKGKHTPAPMTTSAPRLVEALPRSLRTEQQETFLTNIRAEAASRAKDAPDALPYAEPYYWAGFVVSGC